MVHPFEGLPGKSGDLARFLDGQCKIIAISKCPPGSYQLIDPLTILRDSKTGSFPYFQQGKLLYHDPCHLSIEGNRRLQPLFETAFRAGTKK